MLQVATILPLRHINLESDNDYHMTLAHLAGDNHAYRAFFRAQAMRGSHVVMDNGVVETGHPMSAARLFELGEFMGVTEVILPDCIGDMAETVRLGREALQLYRDRKGSAYRGGMMVAPQGRTLDEWLSCVMEFAGAPEVTSIGISKFATLRFGIDRLEAAKAIYDVTKRPIHLLGCPADPLEVFEIQRQVPTVRGVDSGIAAFYTAAGVRMGPGVPRPESEVDFLDGAALETTLMRANYYYWKQVCIFGSAAPNA